MHNCEYCGTACDCDGEDTFCNCPDDHECINDECPMWDHSCINDDCDMWEDQSEYVDIWEFRHSTKPELNIKWEAKKMTDDKSCSCYVKVTGAICEGHTYTHEIVYCPLHDAAPELLEALKKAKWNLSLCKQFTMVKELRKIIARAEGKEVNDG